MWGGGGHRPQEILKKWGQICDFMPCSGVRVIAGPSALPRHSVSLVVC